MYQDKILLCKDCGNNFPFTANEQEFFASKGFTNEPGRCPGCRSAKKEQSGRNGYNHAHFERQMYPAVCHTCGTITTVPFRPNGDKPVYCRDCFKPKRQY